jgi:hypothetical protein
MTHADASDTDAPSVESERNSSAGLPWARLAGAAAVLVSGTVVATLAATHKSARHENAKAYIHGMNDALHSVRQSIRDGTDPMDL